MDVAENDLASLAAVLNTAVTSIRSDITDLRSDIADIRSENQSTLADLRSDIADIRSAQKEDRSTLEKILKHPATQANVKNVQMRPGETSRQPFNKGKPAAPPPPSSLPPPRSKISKLILNQF